MTNTDSHGQKLGLLIVCDNPSALEYLEACLDGENFEIHRAVSAREGLESAVRLRPACILLDLSISKEENLQVCGKIKNDPMLRGAAVIILCLADEESAVRLVFEAGADDCLTKPFRATELVARIRARSRMRKDIGAAVSALGPQTSADGRSGKSRASSGKGSLADPFLLSPHLEFFNSLADGVLLMDKEHRVLYLNPSVEAMAGRSAQDVVGGHLTSLFDSNTAGVLLGILKNLDSRQPAHAGEISLRRPDGSRVDLSARVGAPRSDQELLLVYLRDVTEEQRIAQELQSTKHFLENLIDSSVDAIVAADLKGNVILFNKGAERILGRSADEVIGKMNVSQLYPPGVAQEIMQQIRLDRDGGTGRLRPTRKEIMAKNGEVIPIQLTAWTVMEDNKGVATAGIFHDLRERLQIERKLSQAQEKLLKTEKQAMIAELAGATAHELNQPLTSMLGYAELAKRKLKDNEEVRRILDIVITETERMADIVRKIGNITRYETKSYVGQQRIVDLDRSSEPD